MHRPQNSRQLGTAGQVLEGTASDAFDEVIAMVPRSIPATATSIDALRRAPGSHDGDVGLPDYVGGWMAHGHPGYYGYAWYRRAVTVPAGGPSWDMLGPTLVDHGYELYWNGERLGGSGANDRRLHRRPDRADRHGGAHRPGALVPAHVYAVAVPLLALLMVRSLETADSPSRSAQGRLLDAAPA
jgi:hypothetical protein